MGQEILYCHQCRRRVVGAEFSRGQAFQVGNHVSCSACAADLLRSLGAKEREQLLGKMFQATQDRHAAAPTAGPKRQSTVRLPAVPPPARKPSPLLPVLVGGGLLVVAVLILFLRKSDPPKPEPPRAAATVTAPVLEQNRPSILFQDRPQRRTREWSSGRASLTWSAISRP